MNEWTKVAFIMMVFCVDDDFYVMSWWLVIGMPRGRFCARPFCLWCSLFHKNGTMALENVLHVEDRLTVSIGNPLWSYLCIEYGVVVQWNQTGKHPCRDALMGCTSSIKNNGTHTYSRSSCSRAMITEIRGNKNIIAFLRLTPLSSQGYNVMECLHWSQSPAVFIGKEWRLVSRVWEALVSRVLEALF